ncbi:cytochrome b [Amaricoccus solimangrovi]|uniref:Cytochrome b n=1 Tax=Amaricoccus solimangrovi TaxID=2589815 RepID=A0A501WK83_9RHOB|nr:cytochrome b/b6 domain-containing protein [Amaricoccus solimangrovi]TPE47567.1 cytochrome b [Amaricoccus solimangrovi]
MGYGTVSRLFHWTTVLIVLVMIPVGLTMIQDLPRSVQDPLFILHKGLGSVFLTLILARIVWRLRHPPPPLPESIPAAQRRVAALSHALLYLLLLTMAVSGYVRVTTGGFPIELLNALGIPPLFSKHESVSLAAKSVHLTTVIVLIAVIALHVGAALHHALVRRDGVLARMWPPVAPR